MRLSEELARILKGPPERRRRRPAGQAPNEIVPTEPPAAGGRPERAAAADPFDAARERLRAQIPPRDEPGR